MSILYITVLAGLVIFIALWLSYEFYEFKTGVPTFPTMPAVRRKIIDIIRQEPISSQPFTILDLGSGSGQLSWNLARTFPNAHVIGIELSYIPWLRSVIRQRLYGLKNLEYKREDFWSHDCSTIDVVVTYLPGKIMERLGKKLRDELKPNALIVANNFPLSFDWKPLETFIVRVPFKMSVFLYRQMVSGNPNPVGYGSTQS